MITRITLKSVARTGPSLACAAALVGAVSLPAQSVDEGSANPITLDTFVVRGAVEDGYFASNSMIATGFKQEIYRTPLNISLLTEEFLTDLGLSDLTSAAGYLSGVAATPDGFQPNAGFQVRGIRTSWTSRNGLRQYAGVGGDNVDRVEVIKGPASIFFGQVAPGGVVNYATKRASEVPRHRLTLEIGGDEHRRALLESQGPISKQGGLSYRVVASRLDREDWRDFEYEKRDYVFGGVQLSPHRRLRIFAEAEYVKSEQNDAHELLGGNLNWVKDYASPPSDLVAFYPGQTVEQVRTRWRTNFTEYTKAYTSVRGTSPGSQRSDLLPEVTPSGWAFNPHGPQGRIELESKITALEASFQVTDWLIARGVFQQNHNDRISMGNFSTLIRSAEGAIRPAPSIIGNVNRSRHASFELAASARFAGADHRVLLGSTQYKDDYRSTGAAPKPTAQLPAWATANWNPNTDPVFDIREYFDLSNGLRGTGIGKRGEDNSTTAWNATAVSEWMGRRLTTMLGVRDETYEKGVYTQGSRDTTFAVQEFGGVTPMGGAVFEIVPGVSIFGSYSEAYLPGAAGGARISGPGATAEELRLTIPNQEGYGYDAGFKVLALDNKLSGTMSVFEVGITNNVRQRDEERTDADPRNLDGTTTNDVVWYYVGGETRSRGLELDVLYRPFSSLQLQASYAWLWEAKVVSNPTLTTQEGQRLAMTPEHQASLWGKYSFKSGRAKGLELGIGGRYRDTFLQATQPSGNTSVAEAAVIVDGLVAYKWPYRRASITSRLNVRNLLDERYLVSGARPGEARSVVLSTSIGF